MNENLQRTLAAADAAINGGNSGGATTSASNNASDLPSMNTAMAAAVAAANERMAHEAAAAAAHSSSAGTPNNPGGGGAAPGMDNNKQLSLGAQLSVALCQHYASQPSVIASDSTISSTAPNNAASTTVTSSALGGIGIASGLNPGAKSITTGSAGLDKSYALGYPTVMEVDGGPTLLQASEMHYTETLKKNPNFLPANK